MTARDRILQRLRGARPHLPPSDVSPLRAAATADGAATSDECLSRFAVEATALGVELFVEDSPAAVAARVAALTDDLRVLCWDPEHLPYGVASVLQRPTLGRAPRREQAEAQIGLTGCDAAIAETASLVLFSAPGRSRAVSLLPPVHIAVVRRDQLYFAMADVLSAHRGRMAGAASCTFITGPSRTADIELTLTLGIHGPGKVIVIIGP